MQNYIVLAFLVFKLAGGRGGGGGQNDLNVVTKAP